jgi:thioester reductase-like protein
MKGARGGILITGATGYIGSYVVHFLLEGNQDLLLLVRARTHDEARGRLWRALQLHMDAPRFRAVMRERIRVFLGELTQPGLGLGPEQTKELVRSTTSVIHVAASLNRRSAKACFNVNLRGTLELIKLARGAHEDHGLRRFSDVSTTAVAGKRRHAIVAEEEMVDWDISDHDPYARTKKLAEHLVRELLPGVPVTVLRPSTVLGDSRFPETTQFDMVRAFAFLAGLPLLPLAPDWRLDIVPADFVGRAIAAVHQSDEPGHDAYNLSAGAASPTYREVVDALANRGHDRRPVFAPWLFKSFSGATAALARTPRRWGLSRGAALLEVFLPYLRGDLVFDNRRIVERLGERPASFVSYAHGLLRFATETGFRYPYLDWPG